MIAKLTGLAEVVGENLIVNVHDVGYKVYVGPTLQSRIDQSQPTTLYIHTHVSETALDLYGFANQIDLKLFSWLLKVSGVGPRTACMVADLGIDRVTHAVQQADTTTFTKLPRVGRKLAEKIIIDLRTKLGEVQSLNLAPASSKQQDLIQALIKMGFDEGKVEKVVRQMDLDALDDRNALAQAIKLVTHG